jgi:hypothetical protein
MDMSKGPAFFAMVTLMARRLDEAERAGGPLPAAFDFGAHPRVCASFGCTA